VDLGDRGQPFGHWVVAAGLADLQGDERGDLVAERGRIYVGSVPGDHAAVLQPLQPRLHGAAGDAETAGSLQLVTFDRSIPLDAVHGARAANLTVL
jgi:hypothetical protein